MKTKLIAALCVLALAPPMAAAQAPTDCVAAAATQSALNACAYEDFLAASGEQAQRLKALDPRLSAAQRTRFRAAQKAWIGWRSAQCDFESGAAAGGSVREFVRWGCAARLTRERTQALEQMAACREGDAACPLRP